MVWSEFFSFALVGLLAQLIDGALGMAYGLVSSSILLAMGLPPAVAAWLVRHLPEKAVMAAVGALIVLISAGQPLQQWLR